MQIKIYGDDAKKIHAGQRFIATEDSVEGHKVVILESLTLDEEINKLSDEQVKERYAQAIEGTTEHDLLAGEMICRGLMFEARVLESMNK